MKRSPVSKKWTFWWSAIAALLLWRFTHTTADTTGNITDPIAADVAAHMTEKATAISQTTDSLFSRLRASETTAVTASDQLTYPPVMQSSATGDYRFVVSATDQWQTPIAIGQLYQDSQLRWEQPLPQQYGPRFSMVGSQGHVLLVDEFINVASPYALMLLDAAGEPIVTYAFEDIQQTLSVSAADLTQQATSGWWVSESPQLRPAEAVPASEIALAETVLIATGGTHLVVNLLTGELTSLQD